MKNPDKMSARELRLEVIESRARIAKLEEEKSLAYRQGWLACGNAVMKEIADGQRRYPGDEQESRDSEDSSEDTRHGH